MTWQPSDDVLLAAIEHATAHIPAESCGVVVRGKYKPITNRSTETDAFAMDRAEYFAATKGGGLEAIVHSHVYTAPIASQGDLAMCETTGVPWLILNVPVGSWNVIEPSGYTAPLIGRQWSYGSLDCWGLVRDGFKAFTGREIPDFVRDWEWWKTGKNIIEDNIEAAGFIKLDQDAEPRHCDVIIMQIRAPVPNHCALYIEPEGIMLHQLQGRVSVRETYGGYYRQATRYFIRHRDFIVDEPPPHDPTDRSVWTGENAGREPT
jgi:proteasome lid subunit RPN8/RPN11